MRETYFCYVGRCGDLRMLKRAGVKKAGEIAFKLHLEIDDSNFKAPPLPDVRVVIPGFIPLEPEIGATVEVIE